MGGATGELASVAAADGASALAATRRPYAPSWLDVLFDAIVRLPGPPWLAYVVLAVPGIVLSHLPLWMAGIVPWGVVNAAASFWGVMTIGILGATHYLRSVAGAAFDAFRPALGAGVVDPERARYELTVMPAREILLLTAFSVGITVLYYWLDPVASQVVGLGGASLALRAFFESLTTAVVVALLFQAIRQTRRVNRLHAAAEHVDPFQPQPLYAFSRLTSQTGTVLVLFNAIGIALNPAAFGSDSSIVLYAPWLLLFVVVAIGFFIIPLRGMHGRLEAVRDRLQSESGDRLRTLLGELNRAIDARDTAQVDALDKTISALRHEGEILRGLPSWPWSTGTIRGFASALFLPLVLFLIQRLLSQFLT